MAARYVSLTSQSPPLSDHCLVKRFHSLKRVRSSQFSALQCDSNFQYIQSEEGVPSARGDSQKSSPFEGIPEATPETWAAMTGEGTASANSAPVGVFMLDRYSDSFGSAFKAAEAAAGQASTRLGGRGGGFAWVDAPCQEGFAKALGVSDASVSWGPSRRRCSLLVDWCFWFPSRLSVQGIYSTSSFAYLSASRVAVLVWC